jgi:hypothetical protein
MVILIFKIILVIFLDNIKKNAYVIHDVLKIESDAEPMRYLSHCLSALNRFY